ncbi:serine/threonine-protein kinase [Microbulbifer aggregans]|uniref:serine/threonine-protein kinase n=1 Tax=Microbulbifer aggregans TaxID=1769779 RepID=UPI001CFD3F5F|nr:serine/threonine-protein kinase [Microbulbifer aggregans]
MDIAEPKAGTLAPGNATAKSDSDRYRILNTLGAGGMGIVYLAEDLKLHRQVAIKKLKDDVTSPSARDRIQQEARLLAQLNHPNIVALHDVLEEDGNIALVMEYIEGTTLRAWMREHTPNLQQKLQLLMQICEGLQQAHNLGIIHRDLKPDNILIATSRNGHVTAKISDFGIAKSEQLDEKTLTAENQLAGTVTAMSPEQIQGKTLDTRSDLFSLGSIAFELLCGSRPFEKDAAGALAVANRIANEPHRSPKEVWPAIPEPLAVLLDKLLAKDPAQRPENAQVVYQGITLLHRQGVEAEDEDYTATMTDLFTRHEVKSRRRWQRALAGIAGALLLGGTGYWSWEYFTRLEPQYIAVMPVEISGEIRGEENAIALTKTMVRQALMNSVSQLKASALVSFTPKEGQGFEEQLRTLRDKGITDALFARLDCARARCEIELQRLNPATSQIQQQTGFAFLADKKQESEYKITNSSISLFPSAYSKNTATMIAMSDQDYSDYLSILSRQESKQLSKDDLDVLEQLINSQPKNPNLYRTYTQVATDIFALTDDKATLQAGLDMLERAKSRGISETLTLELELWLHTYNADKSQFDKLLEKVNQQKSPSAALLAKFSRYLFTQGDYESGLNYAQEAAALNPSADNLYLVAINQTASGNYTEARTTLEQITSTFSEHWSSYSLLGVIELESGNFSAAERAITAIPENLRGWRTKSNLGVAYFLQKKYENAIHEYQQVLNAVPDDAYTYTQIAEAQLSIGEHQAARINFAKAVEITEEKTDLEFRLSRAVALANLGKHADAIRIALELVKSSPDDTDTKYTAAEVYSLAGEWHSAEFYITELLDQGMSAEWFYLPVFQQLCTQPQVSNKVKTTICD